MLLAGVGKRYGPRGAWVLRNVDLHVPRGALIRISGDNGSGKSTLLRIIAGICEPGTGRVTGRGSVAYVPERFPPDLPFTALGYLTRLGALHGLTGRESRRRAREWAGTLGFGDQVREPLRALSKGTCQKIAVAQALMGEPDLLVLDEAWTGLDTASRAVLDRHVVGHTGSGGTVVFVDHDPGRLAGEVTAAHRIEAGTVVPAPSSAAAVGVTIEIETGPASPPASLPGGCTWEEAAPGVLRISTTTAHSDPLLRHLLTTVPGVRVRSVRREVRGEKRGDMRGGMRAEGDPA